MARVFLLLAVLALGAVTSQAAAFNLGSVAGDIVVQPSFTGFQGQEFNFRGEAATGQAKFYNLIYDANRLLVNARIYHAESASESAPATFMVTALAVKLLPDGPTFTVNAPNSEDKALGEGVFFVNGEPMELTGSTYRLRFAKDFELKLERDEIKIKYDLMTLEVALHDGHLTLEAEKIWLSDSARGILGETVRVAHDRDGNALTKFTGVNGRGVLTTNPSVYEVQSLDDVHVMVPFYGKNGVVDNVQKLAAAAQNGVASLFRQMNKGSVYKTDAGFELRRTVDDDTEVAASSKDAVALPEWKLRM
eukprot:jgi/Chlat1/5333/Chrsp35S05265